MYAAEKVQDAAYESKMNKVLTLQEHQGVAYGISRFVATVASTLVTLAVLSGGRAAVLTDGMTAAALTSFLFYVTFISNASFDVGDQWSKIQEALGAGKTVFELAQRTPELKEPALDSSSAAQGHITTGYGALFVNFENF